VHPVYDIIHLVRCFMPIAFCVLSLYRASLSSTVVAISQCTSFFPFHTLCNVIRNGKIGSTIEHIGMRHQHKTNSGIKGRRNKVNTFEKQNIFSEWVVAQRFHWISQTVTYFGVHKSHFVKRDRKFN